MKMSYPIRDTDGKEFRSLDDVMRLIDGEAHGTWLLGANGQWHGGIHISDISSPFSALNPDAVNTGEPVPLQFMADGTIVAYRLNNEYLTAPYCGQQLRYSSSFVLVRSQCKPDPQKEKSWLEFYSLYMHLAPESDYPSSPCYKVRDGHSGIRPRQYKNGQNGMPEGDEGDAGAWPAPAKTINSLKAGDRFVSSRTGRFYVTKDGKATLTTFGLVRLLKENIPGDEQYWVTLDPELTEPDGEMQERMPEWMQRAKQKGVFDAVVLTGETEEWKVSAGTAVGFMGCMESPGEENHRLDKEWFVHLEVLSTDPNMPGFLANPENVEGGKKSVLVPKGKALFIRQDVTGEPVFTATSALLSAQCRLSRGAATPVGDESQKWWYKVSRSGWLPQSDVEEVSQYDLLKLGFQALEEDGGGDVMNSPYESWVPEAFGAISRSAEQGADYQYGQVPPFYRELMAEMDSNDDGKVTSEEIRQAMVVREPLVKDVVNRLVVKHHSEWCGGRSTGRWEGFYKDLDSPEVQYCEKWQADMEWMSQVPPFDKDEAVWHFHPVVFLDSIRNKRTIHITPDMLYNVFNGLKSPTKLSFIQEVADEINNHASEYKLDSILRVNHFFAQIREEMGGVASPVEGLNYSEEGLKANFRYFRSHPAEAREYSYTKINGKITKHANEIAIADRVYANRLGNGNILSGDGSTYRGRGGIHLTGKVNYQGFSDYYKEHWDNDVDFINNPSVLEEGVYCVRSAVYFWLREKLYDFADQGDTGSIVDKITAEVNLHTTSYVKRREHFERIKSNNVFADAF